MFASGEVLLQILKVFKVKNHLSHCAVIVYSISDVFIQKRIHFAFCSQFLFFFRSVIIFIVGVTAGLYVTKSVKNTLSVFPLSGFTCLTLAIRINGHMKLVINWLS